MTNRVTIIVSKELWKAFLEKLDTEGKKASPVVRIWIKEYLEKNKIQND